MSSKANETIIELKSVSKRYGFGESETLALNNFDLTVKKGEFIMIMGPSGCGKTTLLNIIGLLDKTTSGEYILNGKTTSQISSRKKAQFRAKEIGFIFQNFNLIQNISVIDNVTLPLTYCGFSKLRREKKADAILERFHLREREYYMPHQLSGGQQQRVAIARSLVADPSIILADEPTGNLDSRSSHIIMEELKQIHSQGNTIIMVTHNPALTTYATRVINMLDGQIDTDIKTVDDKDLPHTNGTEKIAVRVLTQKDTPEINIVSETPVVVTGKNITSKHPIKRPLGSTKTHANNIHKPIDSKPIERKSRINQADSKEVKEAPKIDSKTVKPKKNHILVLKKKTTDKKTTDKKTSTKLNNLVEKVKKATKTAKDKSTKKKESK